MKTPIKNQYYYMVTGNPWLEQLGRLAPGVPASLRQLRTQRDGKLYAILRNHQTLILADKKPMEDFLDSASRPPLASRRAASSGQRS